MSVLRLDGVSKRFGSVSAVRPLSLTIASGEFFSVLGPSGCGKTTLLRMIAGFEKPTTGRIFLGDRDVTGLAPGQRGVGMVFQNYALFPRMTVGQNVAFGLQRLRLTPDASAARVSRALEAVHLLDRRNSHVAELSGGEQQRVAVARAMIVEPSVLLFDEPLSNLDASLRASLRQEIKQLQGRTGITAIYVTHDQGEAMSLSSRMGIMRAGEMLQVASPEDAYRKPGSPFVAEFLGGANVVSARHDQVGNTLSIGGTPVVLPSGIRMPSGKNVLAAIKPEHIMPVPEGERHSTSATVESVEFHGFLLTLTLSVGTTLLRCVLPAATFKNLPSAGERFLFMVDWSQCVFFDGEG